MKKLALMFVLVAAASTAFAQVKTPRPSQKSTLTQTVGLTDLSITYSRPSVKGRTIWGELVPYDKVWRTGANEATTFTVSDDVLVEGQKLAKGTYSLHTIPGKSDWTIIFNSDADQWGSYAYDETKDVLRVKVRPEAAEFAETMGFEMPKVTTDKATVRIHWEKLAVPFTVDTEATKKTMANLKNAMKPDWRTPFSAASFAWENEAAAPSEIDAWLAQSKKIEENISNLWLEARILNKRGKFAEAKALAEKAASKASAEQKDFAAEVRRLSAAWK